ncbi:aminoglycoside N3-acetyltransferase [Natrialba chahannaoensis JCM 10990]|uniref:Aminoglycoside N3-acetyltransferase n=1 Tax=Natrialba chahannaoensis JCM 10990 TaxID=1227492 RepID=M0AR42_9EURY|nr:AAC(3) family N-acetyltransferase [Natrialba chahannaoensis]ELY99853.1 aminoglycoside N3-acetyltransferase [Natrialba chahannaoensis JCM 10990]
MDEADAVDRVQEPCTVSSLTEDLRYLGVESGQTLLVHSSLSSLGWVAGDAQAVVEALQNVVTTDGTLVMPTHTSQYSDPSAWSNPPVPSDWIETIREERPAFQPAATPTRGMGAISECFRTSPDVVRSSHPLYSVAAWGAEAEEIVDDHPLDHGLGEESPLADVYEQDGDVLMLGTDYSTNTSLHLAEHRADLDLGTSTTTVPVLEDGDRVLHDCEELETSTDDFPEVGAAFEDQHDYREGAVGAATATLLEQPALVDFATEWFEANR